MKQNVKRLTAFTLAVNLILCMIPASGFAFEVNTGPSDQTVIEETLPPDIPVETVPEFPAETPEEPEPTPTPEEPEPTPLPEESPMETEVPPAMRDAEEIPPKAMPEVPAVEETAPAEILEDYVSAMEAPMVGLNGVMAIAESDYDINSGSIVLSTPGSYTIRGTGEKTTNTITIMGAGEYEVTLSGVNIDCSDFKEEAAVALQDEAHVHLILSNYNTLASGENRAGVEVPEDCSLEVSGYGDLVVTGGAGQYDAAAGIGGGAKMSNGPITILDGNITANGGERSYNGAAGIGGGCNADGKNITISGGTVTANGSEESYNGASGIGGGTQGDGLDIIIQGGYVTAAASRDSHLGAAGIGGGYMGEAQRLTFSGGSTYAYSSSGATTNGAGIGGGYGGTASYIEISGDAYVYANYNNPNANLDGSNGAGIGGGGAIITEDEKVGGDADHITISGGSVEAYGNSRGAGIGGGANGNATNITITGGDVRTYGGKTPASESYLSGAGIGGGSYGYAEEITIRTGETNYATISAYSSYGSAAIGGGCHGYAKGITIQDSNIYANAHYAESNGLYGYGAGIGGGLYGAGLNILIENSTVNTYSYYGAAIGSGAYVGQHYKSANTQGRPDLFFTAEGAVLHEEFPEGTKVATSIEIGEKSNITAESSYGAAIGSGYANWGVGYYADITERYVVDVYIHDCTMTRVGTSNSGAGIGTGGDARYCLSSIVVDGCDSINAEATSSGMSGASLGSGSGNLWCDMEMSITNCGTLTLGGDYMQGGAGIGTGVSNYGGQATVTVEHCDNIFVSMQYGTGLGTGYSNGSGSTSHGDYKFTTFFTMNVSKCGSIQITHSGYDNDTTCIGSGVRNTYNTVDITVEECGPIAIKVDGNYYYTVGIGVGGSNACNSVHVSILRCGAITVEGWYYEGVGIGIGRSTSSSNQDYPSDYRVLVKNCESILMTTYGSYFTGIGTATSTSSCNGEVVIDNCGFIRINHNNGSDSVGIGYGRGTHWYTTSKVWYDSHVNVQVQNCDDLTIVMNNGYNTGIGMGSQSYYGSGEICITDCGNILVFHGQNPAFNNGGVNYTDHCTGIGLGRNCYNCDLAIVINGCGNVSTQYYKNSNGKSDYSRWCTGIGSGSNCYSNTDYGFTQEDGQITYYPNTLNIQIQNCGAVEACCGDSGVGIGMGYNSRDTVCNVNIQDCSSVMADGHYYATGIGSGQDCYGSYTDLFDTSSTVTILRCEGGVTAKGGRYGAAIGSGGNLRNSATVTVDIQNSGAVTATQYKLVEDNTIPDYNASQRGHAAAIGSGWNNNGNGQVSIHIQSCEVEAYAEDSAAIGCGDRCNTVTVSVDLEDCTVNAQGGCGAGIGMGDNVSNTTVDINLTNCETTAESLAYGAGVGGGLEDSRCTSNITVDGGSLTATGAGGGAGIGTGPKSAVCRANVTIDGDAVVVATGSGATDTRLAEGDDPTGSDAGAGIGGTAGQYVGNITIRSGDITAVGGGIEGNCAAGIGGGANAKAGNVVISGGTVHATAGHCDQCGAAGIGGGANSNAGTVTISGGEVTAIGAHGEKMGGAGIGGGPRGDGGTIIIEGGVVFAIGSERGAGIGGGFNGNGGDVTISGGTTTVIGGLYDSAGIGGGANGEGGTLTLSGDPELKVYGKSGNLAITSEITTSVPLFQGTMAEVSEDEVTVSLLELEGSGEDAVTLPAAYGAFSLTLPTEGTYSAYIELDKRCLLSTLEDSIEEFQIEEATPAEGMRLTVIRFYEVTFDTGDGSPVEAQTVRMNKPVTLPDDPTLDGHFFGGWFTDEDCTNPYDFSLPVTGDMTLYAQWIEIHGQPYVIYHYKASLEGGWDIGTIQYGGEIPGQLVTATSMEYVGFAEDKLSSERVPSGYTQEGETLVLKLYYRRVQIKVLVENAGEDYPTQFTAPYGTLMLLGKPSKAGYDFDRWTDTDGNTIDTTMTVHIEELGDTIFANWVLQEGQAAYQVKHYLRSLEGAYVLRVAEDLSGEVGDVVTVTPNNYTGFHVNHSISDETATGIIQADNSLALRVYYDRDWITVRLENTHNTAGSVTVEYGSAANLPTPSWPGYTFEGWQKEDGSFYQDDDNIETLGEAVTAQWSAGATTLYTVRYYKQDIQGENMEIVSLEDLHGAAGSTVKAAIRKYPGFTYAPELSNVTGMVDAEDPLILNVYYTRNTYKVSFVSNGGTEVEDQTGIYYTALATAPEDPFKIGYDFEGWYTDKTLGDKHNFGVPVTHDMTLYAKWTPRDDTKYTVYHYQQAVAGAGYALADTDHLEGTTGSKVTAQDMDYPGFHRNADHKGNVVSATVAPDGSTVLALYYDRDLYTVTFYANGGSPVSKAKGIRYGAAVPQPSDPTKDGYTFLRWRVDEEREEGYDFTTPISENLSLYALWEANTYRVTFDYQGATGNNTVSSKSVIFGNAYDELPGPTRHGYDFLGWFTEEQDGDEVTADTVVETIGDHTLYSHWSAREDTPYTVEHYHQSPTGVGYELVDTDHLTGTTDTTVIAEPRKYPGLQEDVANALRVGSGNLAGDGSLTLKLYYTRARHTLFIDRANGQGMETYTVLYGAEVTLPADPRRRGYTFAGWTAEGVDLGEGKSFSMPDNAVTLTATWEAVDYSVTYKYTGAVPAGAPQLPSGGKNHNIGDVLEVAEVPTLEGYTFHGWHTDDAAVVDGKFTMPDGNVTFTGEWRKGLHNVIYIYQGSVPDGAPAVPVDTNAYKVGAQVTVQPDPELEGYSFSGWQSDVEIVDGVFKMPVTNVVLRGSWSPVVYSVQFSYTGAVPETAQQLPEEENRAMGETVAVPAVASVVGYRFLGWTVDGVSVEDGAIQMPAKDIVLVGCWEKLPYHVTYAYTGKVPVKAPAVPVDTNVYTLGDTVRVMDSPTLKGYAFSGWGESFSMPAENVTLTGSWSAVTYQITYVLDGGTAPEKNPTSYTVESPSLTFTPATKTGHTFEGWFADSGFTTPVAALPAGSTGDITLYAKWKESAPVGGGGSGGGSFGGGGSGGGPSGSTEVVKPEPPSQSSGMLNKADHMAYIQGFVDGTVRPLANISRAEVAAIFFRLLTEEVRKENATTVHSFTDVEEDGWYTEAVATLTAMGIVKGRGDGVFDPTATISRSEFAVIAARFDSAAYTGPDLFPDIHGHWASEEINRAAQKGWVKGDDAGMFRPDAPITRAEAVTLINRVLERRVDKSGVLEEMKTFPDNADPTVWYYYAIQEAANGHAYTKDKDGREHWVEIK